MSISSEERIELKNEIKDAVGDLIENLETRTSSQFNIIDYKLDAIEKQTTRTNGRLSEAESKLKNLEKSEKDHILRCPNNQRIRELEDVTLTAKTIKRVLIQGLVLTGIVMTIILGLFTLLN